ncbi:uncharacterized protein LACBIDRAFT_296345 [Laccaria bicolor S238N-H82]|uniref:Predicted protein n=1 Tax=Laccaria bicolor (strain S238N-H82 / ATCC MYA-4686) TaxID=486041 RepID=B0D8J8_LACBS|nr:uncharacterized protein LACBIDRAFT_296345 [Laccaria bicolor S238N-H82]EDR09086.1 predicted protein [Laccaria bicolor S238N-H82]|eukprot:XP_001880399.1 predicted protein [Laccaria bicolor S238N-H82]
MPLNIPGLLVPFQLVLYPRLVLPSIAVKDIRHIDFHKLRRAGYRGIVFDKDNCLTLPHKDFLVPELTEAWKECREAFGDRHVLIVSNSAGTWLDAGGIQAESVSHHLQAPVLHHKTFKPAYSCISAIRTYFLSLSFAIRDEELVIVGDRIFTDVVMANRMRKSCESSSKGILGTTLSCAFEKSGTVATEKGASHVNDFHPAGPLAIWTTGVWEKESMVMRWFERSLVKTVERWSGRPQIEPKEVHQFVKSVPKPVPSRAPWFSGFSDLLTQLRRG